MIIIKDIFIGNYRISQKFGMNPAMYARFGLKGHNGIDFATPTGTQLICCFDEATVVRAEDDKTGYGKHLRIWDKKQECVAIYGHCDKLLVKVGDVVKRGQLIAFSGNTGFSTGPHLHFAIAKVNNSCIRQNTNNGYGGWMDVLDKTKFKWEVSNLKEPVKYGISDNKPDYEKLLKDKESEISHLKEELQKAKDDLIKAEIAFQEQLAVKDNECQEKRDAYKNEIVAFINSLKI
jgi:murein DD-endopeptidase MepM/ murein hydrolase activator NlpD